MENNAKNKENLIKICKRNIEKHKKKHKKNQKIHENHNQIVEKTHCGFPRRGNPRARSLVRARRRSSAGAKRCMASIAPPTVLYACTNSANVTPGVIPSSCSSCWLPRAVLTPPTALAFASTRVERSSISDRSSVI